MTRFRKNFEFAIVIFKTKLTKFLRCILKFEFGINIVSDKKIGAVWYIIYTTLRVRILKYKE